MAYSVSPNPGSVLENQGLLTFRITRTGSFPAETLFASTINGAANGFATNTSDYATNVNNLPVTFAAGETFKDVSVSILDDLTPESNETFGFIVQRNATDPLGTFLANSTFTIIDNDAASTSYSISPNPGSAAENQGTLTFHITRSGTLNAETLFASTVNGAANGFATNSGDYATNINNLPFAFAA
jgi:large repetitive protein